MLNDLQNSVISAVLLVMVVVISALGVRSGLLSGHRYSGSFLTALLTLFLIDVSLNIVVLFSLILAVGMLVDGAIVVTEFAERKLSERVPGIRPTCRRRHGYNTDHCFDRDDAGGFLTAGVLARRRREFMKYLPMTVLITLIASLLMALIFVPTIGAVIGKKTEIVSGP